MAKRILSWVLTCALLLTCVSGLTLISSAASTVASFDATSGFRNSDNVVVGSKDGFKVIQWNGSGAIYWNNNMLGNAVGLTADTKIDTLTVTVDAFWERGANAGNNWWHFQTRGFTDATNNGNGGDGYMNLSSGSGITTPADNVWTEITVERADQAFGRGDDLAINFGDLNDSKFYIRGIKAVAKVGEDTYTAVWGSYQVAKLDFSSGEAVGTNAAITHNHPDEDDAEGNGIFEVAGAKGIKMTTQNRGFGIKFADIGLNGQDVAVTVEYYMPSTSVGDNTRFSMNGIAGKNYAIRVGGNGNNTANTALTKDAWAAYTFIVSGEQAAHFVDGASVNTYCYNDKENNGEAYYIKSVSLMPASYLASVADPGYDYYDFVKTYAPNPYYAAYTEAEAYGIVAQWGDNGGQLYFKTSGLDNETTLAVMFYLADGSEATDVNIDYQNVAEADGWKGKNGNVAAFEDGVATFMLEDAVFQNGLNGLGSFRMNAENAAKISRVEIYTPTDKTALNEAIAAAEATSTEGKTETSIAALTAAIEAAKAIADEAFALESDVAAAAKAVTDAIAGLKDIIAIEKGDNIITAAQAAVINNCQLENGGANIGMANNGSYVEYEVDVKEAGYYAVTVNAVTCNGNGWQQLTDGNGTALAEAIQIPAASDWGAYADYSMGKVLLQAGLQKIRVAFVNEGSNLKQMTLNYVAMYSEIDFSTGAIATVNGAMGYNHTGTNEELGTTDGMKVISEEIGSGYMLYKQNNGFGFVPNNNAGWLAEGQNVNMTISYYAASETTKDNTRIRVRVGEDVKKLDEEGNEVKDEAGNTVYETKANWYEIKGADMTKDAVATASFALTEQDAAMISAGKTLYFYFASSDNSDTNLAEPVYVTNVLLEVAIDKSALEEAVNNAIAEQGDYTKDSWNAYQAAVEAAKAVLANADATKMDVDTALTNLQNAEKALTLSYAEITFNNEGATTVNGAFGFNHPDEDDGDEGNGIYKVAEDVDAYGIKLSKQNRGFGFNVTNNGWIKEGDLLKVSVTYYIPEGAAQDNTRVWVEFDGSNNIWRFADSLKAGVVDTVTYELTAEQSAKFLTGSAANMKFFNYNDNDTAGDYAYIIGVRMDIVPPEYYEIPDPNWTNLADGAIGTFEEQKVIAWNTTGALAWNSGAIAQALGIDENIIADVEITVSAYWQSSGQGDWWHFNTVNEDGSSATSLTGTPNDNGFGLLNAEGYGLVPNEWTTITVSREKQQVGNAYDNLYINVGGLAEGNAVYINGLTYVVTLEDGTVVKGLWGVKPEVTTPDEGGDEGGEGGEGGDEGGEGDTNTDVIDVIVESATSSVGNVVMVGQSINLTAVIKNNGNVALAEGTKYGVAFIITDAEGVQVGIVWSDNYKNIDVAPELAVGDTLTVTSCGGNIGDGDGKWTPDAAGVYTVNAWVNDNTADGIPNETVTENNQLQFTITVTNLNIADLQAAIADAEAIEDLTIYTDETAKALTDALAAAKAALAKADATQEEIDAAAKALTDAKAALAEKPDEPIDEPKMWGDVDGNGKVNTTDARLTLQRAADRIDDTKLDVTVADVDGNGKINTTDARLILQKAADRIEKFPVEETAE